MRKRCRKGRAAVLLIVLLVLVIGIVWIIMQQNTNAVVLEIENAVQNVDIHRTYTLHNFHTGYIWVVIHFDVVDKNGTVIASHQGGPKAGTKFRIEKQNGKWHITDFYEQNSHETRSDEIHYLLPDWDLTKQ